MNPRVRLASFALAFVVAVGMLGACAGKDGSKSNSSPSGSTSATPSESSVKPGVKLTKHNFFDAVLAAMVKADSTHVTMSLRAGDTTTKATGVLHFADPLSMSLNMSTAAGKTDVVFVGGVFYIHAAQLSGDQFVIVETDKDDQFSQLYKRMPDLMSPTTQAETYRKAVHSIAQTGDPITIDGVSATPYVLVMDTAKMGDLADMGLPGVAKKIPKTVTLTWWVGPDDLLRRADVGAAGATTRLTYSRWGQPVTIKKPTKVADKTLQQLINEAPA